MILKIVLTMINNFSKKNSSYSVFHKISSKSTRTILNILVIILHLSSNHLLFHNNNSLYHSYLEFCESQFRFRIKFTLNFPMRNIHFNLHPSLLASIYNPFLKIYYLFSFTKKKILLENFRNLYRSSYCMQTKRKKKLSFFFMEKQKSFFFCNKWLWVTLLLYFNILISISSILTVLFV